MEGGDNMNDYTFSDKVFEELLPIEDGIRKAESPCSGCAIIMGDDPCTVCPHRTAKVTAAIERRHSLQLT